MYGIGVQMPTAINQAAAEARPRLTLTVVVTDVLISIDRMSSGYAVSAGGEVLKTMR